MIRPPTKMIKKALGRAKPTRAQAAPKKRGGMAGMVGRAMGQARGAKPTPKAPTRTSTTRRAPAGQGRARVGMSRPGVGTPRARSRPVNQGGNPGSRRVTPKPAARRTSAATAKPTRRAPPKRATRRAPARRPSGGRGTYRR